MSGIVRRTFYLDKGKRGERNARYFNFFFFLICLNDSRRPVLRFR